MAAPRIDRRLAAILAADVVGYSRLMERDEAGTLDRVRTHHKEFVEPLIAEHGGRIVKLMGNGLLVEFGSAVDAVRCAALLQRGMAERRDRSATPEQPGSACGLGSRGSLQLGSAAGYAFRLTKDRQKQTISGGSRA